MELGCTERRLSRRIMRLLHNGCESDAIPAPMAAACLAIRLQLRKQCQLARQRVGARMDLHQVVEATLRALVMMRHRLPSGRQWMGAVLNHLEASMTQF